MREGFNDVDMTENRDIPKPPGHLEMFEIFAIKKDSWQMCWVYFCINMMWGPVTCWTLKQVDKGHFIFQPCHFSTQDCHLAIITWQLLGGHVTKYPRYHYREPPRGLRLVLSTPSFRFRYWMASIALQDLWSFDTPLLVYCFNNLSVPPQY